MTGSAALVLFSSMRAFAGLRVFVFCAPVPSLMQIILQQEHATKQSRPKAVLARPTCPPLSDT